MNGFSDSFRRSLVETMHFRKPFYAGVSRLKKQREKSVIQVIVGEA